MEADDGSNVLEALALADDIEAVRAAKHIYDQALPLLSKPAALTASGQEPPVVGALMQSLRQGENVVLSDSESVATARWVLLQLLKSPGGGRLVLDALKGWQDDTQRVGVRLQWTLAGTLLLLVATTEVEFGPNGFHLHKKTIIPEQLEATATFLKAKVSVKVFEPSGQPKPPANP